MLFSSFEGGFDTRNFVSFFSVHGYNILKNIYEEEQKKDVLPLKISILTENITENRDALLKKIKQLDPQHIHAKYYENLLSLLLCNSFNECVFQSSLEKINEKTEIRKKNGVYYTPEDVSSFILVNSVELLLNEKILKLKKETDFANELLSISKLEFIKDEIVNFKILDPTCGTGAFLVKAFDFKVSLVEKVCGDINACDIIKIIDSLYGNDIDKFSTYITQTRLLFRALSIKDNIDVSVLLKSLMHNFFNYDFVEEFCKITEQFDLIIGNPPYVEKSTLSKKTCAQYGNIYADVVHNSFNLLKNKGVIGYIIPLSYISTPRFSKLRMFIQENASCEYVLSYADRPDCLFAGVHQKLNILFAKKKNKRTDKHTVYTSDYIYWYKAQRRTLFNDLNFIENTFISSKFYPKLGNDMEKSIYSKIIGYKKNIYDLQEPGHKLYLNMRATFWIKSFIKEPYKSNEYKEFSFNCENVHFVNLILNSSLFWWFWVKTSDCWHITQKELALFGVPTVSSIEHDTMAALSLKLNELLENTKEEVNTKQTLYEYKHKKCKSLIDEIDAFLCALYELSTNEVSYIKSYKEKYRIGIDKW